jgi:DNA uptake protein ComE-like DNA-binding protein
MMVMAVMEVQHAHLHLRVASELAEVNRQPPETQRSYIFYILQLFIDVSACLSYSSAVRIQPSLRRSLMLNLRRKLLAAALLLAAVPGITLATAQTPKPAPAAATANLLDINTATADQIKALPGIGDAYTKRIIDGRPYTAKNQLVTRGILPQKTYDGIKNQIVATHAPKK